VRSLAFRSCPIERGDGEQRMRARDYHRSCLVDRGATFVVMMRLASTCAIAIACVVATPVFAAPPPPAPMRTTSRAQPRSYDDAMHAWTLRRDRLRAGFAISMTALLAGGLAIGLGAGLGHRACARDDCFEPPMVESVGLGVGIPLALLGLVGATISGGLWELHTADRPAKRLSLRAGGLSLRF
jgi:hypothetical protein